MSEVIVILKEVYVKKLISDSEELVNIHEGLCKYFALV